MRMRVSPRQCGSSFCSRQPLDIAMGIPARLPPLEATSRAGERGLGDIAGTSARVVAISLPPAQRDLRLDLFRGLANWAMFLGHIPSSVLAWLTLRNYGFSDGADLFVFISGYTSGIVYARRTRERGFVFGATRVMRRVWQIYVAHVLLLAFYLASIHFLSQTFNAPDFIDRYNVAPLTSAPVEALIHGLILKYKPVNLDVLPLYVVLMACFPPVLWLMLKHRNAVMLVSVLLYLAARQSGWNLPSYPSGVWYFNPLAWQLLFVLGAWSALGGVDTLHFLVRSPLVGLGRRALSSLCGSTDIGDASTGTSSNSSARSVRSLQPQRQNQPGSLSRPASGDSDHRRGAIHTDRGARTEGRRLAAASEMRPTVSRGVLRRNLPLICRCLYLGTNVRRRRCSIPRWCWWAVNHDGGSLLQIVVQTQ